MDEKELCEICKLNEYCQHNFDYQCQQAFDHQNKHLTIDEYNHAKEFFSQEKPIIDNLKQLLKDLEELKANKNQIRFGHYIGVNKALDLLIKELDYMTILE